ncbi:uncharacterized protein LOC108201008 [Daucus carota subsp. sativus]|uniref:uncharacterized protein LOC108201008 n=1 Tax=Daucus carota subsp. sativus TaxID=79200 RepID=UPI0007EF64A7|nr:PREDICTED: uncharacterized protein LOC108201008 [Daucus carota subsp. sativus]
MIIGEEEGGDNGGGDGNSVPVTRIFHTIKNSSRRPPTSRQLFASDASDSSGDRPVSSDPTGRKKSRRKEHRTLVETPQGKQVLSSDARLHLEKLKRKRQALETVNEEVNADLLAEVEALDKQRQLLELKVRQKEEIMRLQERLGVSEHQGMSAPEYQTVSRGRTSARDPTWHPSADSAHSGRSESATSFTSKQHRRKQSSVAEHGAETCWSEGGTKVVIPELSKIQDDLAVCKDYVRNQAGGLETLNDSPLTEDIENAPVDRHLKFPPMDHFDGTSDPADFLNTFDGRMSLQGHADSTRCRFFCTCLKGNALSWFQNLPPRSINSWAMLKVKFRTRFSSNKRGGKITASLMTVRQRSSESLRDFLARFRVEMADIPNLIDELAVNYLAAGVDKRRHGPLLEEFFEKNPRTLQAAMQIFERRLTLQEAVGSIQTTSPPPRRSSGRYQERLSPRGSRWEPRRTDVRASNREDKTEPGQARTPRHDRQNASPAKQRSGRQWPPRPPREEKEFTKLTTDINSILAILKTDPNYRPPRPMNPNRAPSTRYCEYHEDTGHTTDRCFQLKNLIEDKVKSGELAHFAVKEEQYRAHTPPRDRVIDVISGGFQPFPTSGSQSRGPQNEIFRIDSKRPKKNPSPVISFSDNDYAPNATESHRDALVITTKIGVNTVKKILVDDGSSADILYQGALSRMDIGERKVCDQNLTPLYGFTGNEVRIVGTIDLPVLFGYAPQQKWIIVKFHIVNSVSCYNAILGRTTLGALRAITSITHLKMKFPTEFGVGEMRGDQMTSRQCYDDSVAPKRKGSKSVNHVATGAEDFSPEGSLESIDPERKVLCEPIEDTEEVALYDEEPTKVVKVGKSLSPVIKSGLIALLREYRDVFAWTAIDMPGIPEEIALHRLNIKPGVKPVRQKKRIFSPEKQQAIGAEINKLLEAGFIKEVQFPKWIANAVLVKKSNGKWRMCIDYSDLNRACPKDFYPLPNIDQLIDSTVGNELISFMDAFSGYNQIKLAKGDQTSTAFITHRGVFAYRVVPFGLLNAGATFQRTMDKIFAPQIGRNMSIYVDDMIVKSAKANGHLEDLKETFDRIRAHSVRLNPAKCSFGLSGGKFLGYLLTQRGIEADPLQIKAIRDMQSPRSLKELQTLTGCIAALRRFIPQSSKRTLPLHDSIKQALKSGTFTWSAECEEAFIAIKQFLASPPILTKANPCEPLKIYLSATDLTTAAVLVKEEDGEQKAVYYVSHMLKEAEVRYSNVEKMVLSLVMASRKLRHYF